MMGDLQVHLPTLQCVQQFLTKNSVNPIPYPPYQPDLSLSDVLSLLLFVSLDEKKILKGKCFADVEVMNKKQQKH